MDLENLANSGCLNLALYEELYALYKKDPASVDPSWREIFQNVDSQPVTVSQPRSAPPLQQPGQSENPVLPSEEHSAQSVLYYPRVEISGDADELRIKKLIDTYRTYGHLMASVNPIDIHPIEEPNQLKIDSPSLGFSKSDLATYYPTCGLLPAPKAPLLEIVNTLKSIYCDKIGYEYMHLQGPEFEKWVQEKIEHTDFRSAVTVEQKHAILEHLNKSELFEMFLHTKYVGQKRFSLEGGETLIPMLASLIDTLADMGANEFFFGMAHRGRLNVLSNIFDKSYSEMFSEFEEGYIPASVEGSGDVKYHKGYYSEVKTIRGHTVKLTLTPNPSHLESVDPVVEGQVRARQTIKGNIVGTEGVIPILIHGDAAIAGQGIVYETMQMSFLEGYSTGGTIHLVINNQIGFTTVPTDGRSTFYCTDLAKAFHSPVFHVNAEDPEGCVFIANLAAEIRHRFHIDVFIDINCYRKYGHNETDEPAYTQPLEYQVIKKKLPIREIYRDFLIHHNIVEKQMAEDLEVEFKACLQDSQKVKKLAKKPSAESVNEAPKESHLPHIQTGVPIEILQTIGERICHLPEGLIIHPKLHVLNKDRLSMLSTEHGARPLDWGMAELLAYGTLLWDGTPVRLSGQDSCRGTFSHRHAMLMDQTKEQGYIPLQHLRPDQGRFDIYNSPLSEFSVLGFEFGYSTANLQSLVIWEAQFGDFCNSAQVIIDQYITTTEQKWGQKCALTLFLPHGYEGQGPEHSSGRIERFLTLCGDNNIQVTNPTTPAQLFHLLRRQVMRTNKKPLIVFTPKGLLRHPGCTSALVSLSQGSFQEILDDPSPPKRPRRLLFCSGRIYYDLIAERDKTATEDLAIVRIEQLYPLDIERLREIIANYGNVKECIWAQEEPSNMGAWSFLRPILRDALPAQIELNYIGRTRSAATAVGSHAIHKQEHADIIDAIFGVKQPSIFDIAGHHKA